MTEKRPAAKEEGIEKETVKPARKSFRIPKQKVGAKIPPNLRALVVTGLISAVAAFACAAIFSCLTAPKPVAEHKIAVVDIVKMTGEVTKLALAGGNVEELMNGVANGMRDLAQQGYVILDARYVISAPDSYIIRPSRWVEGADDNSKIGGYSAPTLGKTPVGEESEQATTEADATKVAP